MNAIKVNAEKIAHEISTKATSSINCLNQQIQAIFLNFQQHAKKECIKKPLEFLKNVFEQLNTRKKTFVPVVFVILFFTCFFKSQFILFFMTIFKFVNILHNLKKTHELINHFIDLPAH